MYKDLNITAEQQRLNANEQKNVPLERWGPYLSERQWGTVREDYSPHGDAWNYLSHEQARSRVYRWGEDGLAGMSDMYQRLCFSVALWNGNDAILKERLYGLTNQEGNHGEDVKELYYYLDNTPTHSYMQYLYKYPQAAFPYEQLKALNRTRNKTQPEFELLDTGIFSSNAYFDVLVTYAKNNADDICIDLSITNRGAVAAPLAVLPTLWFRNRWLFHQMEEKPVIKRMKTHADSGIVKAFYDKSTAYNFYFAATGEALMTENETNNQKIFGTANKSVFVKDAFHTAVVDQDEALLQKLKRKNTGTKFSPLYRVQLEPGETKHIYMRLSQEEAAFPFDDAFHAVFENRKSEADDFYSRLLSKHTTHELAVIQRQALAGLLWNKQYYRYDIEQWLGGDRFYTDPPGERLYGRNHNWEHLKIADVLSMPDKWEYPWFAAWDLCFHCIPLAMVDPVFAKNQLILLCREWFMSPPGQIPAYEWDFSNVNPPLIAWAALEVFKTDKEVHAVADYAFLKRIFQKLLINFTWWANRQDENENNIFTGGFLGLDNIGVIDRSNLPHGSSLEQVDATAWMGMYALNMMEIALEIAQADPSFEDAVTKFYEHFTLIASSLNKTLWDAEDNFFYDRLHTADGEDIVLKVRSIVGLSVLFDAAVIKNESLKKLPDFTKRMNYLKNYYKDHHKALPEEQVSENGDILLSLIHKDRLVQLLQVLLDENEFLSPGGIRALSKFHREHPFSLYFDNTNHSISYLPGESDNSMFGGNSNWRGPVWIPMNYLIIHTLYKLHNFYGNGLKVAYPTGSAEMMNLEQVADEISGKNVSIFKRDENGDRPVHAGANAFYKLPENKDLILFYEYFNGDTAAGIGASHQTGWTSLIARFIR